MIFKEQNRDDLRSGRPNEVIAHFYRNNYLSKTLNKSLTKSLPKQELRNERYGKVMGMASKEMAGKADGKTISTIVKQKLNN